MHLRIFFQPRDNSIQFLDFDTNEPVDQMMVIEKLANREATISKRTMHFGEQISTDYVIWDTIDLRDRRPKARGE